MTNIEKTEVYLTGYLQALVGKEFTQSNFETVISHIDLMLHKQNLDDINAIDFEKIPLTPPEGRQFNNLFN